MVKNKIATTSAENARVAASLNRAYSERNRLAIGMALATIAAGGKAGHGIDPAWQDKGWQIEWATVVYIDLPSGKQLSYHMSPEEAAQAQELLPLYEGVWDGSYLGRRADWLEHYNVRHDARQMSDQMVCSCGVAWDVNDPFPPEGHQ